MSKQQNIFGVGTDIIAISRFKRSIEKYGQKFLDRIFTKSEQEYCNAFSENAPRFAVRFSAKEAIVKALGCGFGEILSFQDIEITKDALGKPYVKLSKGAMKHYNNPTIHLSLSHCKEYATAVAIALN